MTEIALALGGGGVKGIAHIGVIKRLEKEGFKIRAIAGTSAGGIVGAVYAAGVKLDHIISELGMINHKDFFARKPEDPPSLLGLAGLVNFLNSYLEDKNFTDLSIPLALTAVDIRSKQEIILNKGNVIQAVLATVAIPGVFPPVYIHDFELVDGGVLDPVPVAVARWLAPHLPVVAVCLSPTPEEWREMPELSVPIEPPLPRPILHQISQSRFAQSLRIFVNSMDITARMVTELRLQVEKPDVIIRPEVHHVAPLDRVNPKELVEAGEQSVIEILPRLHESLAWYYQIVRRFRDAQPPGKVLEEDITD